MWAWFTEMDVQSTSNGPAMELARVKWEMSVGEVLAGHTLYDWVIKSFFSASRS